MRKQILAFISSVLIAGCASAPQQPEWLNGESAKYPSSRYLTGLGQADSAAIARDRARADLAKVFQVTINERMRDNTAVSHTRVSGQGARQSMESHIERQLTLSTQQVLRGVKVPEVWRDNTKRYHALAVFDRLRAGEQLRKQITSLDSQVEREIEQAGATSDLLSKIAAADRAVEAQLSREQSQTVLRVVDPTGVGVPSRYDSARLESDVRQLAGRLRLDVSVDEDATGRLASLLAGSVAHAGFVSAPEDESDYRLVGALYLNNFEAEGWQWSRGTLNLKLLDAHGGVRGTWEWPVKASAQQSELARQRALKQVEQQLKSELRRSILSP